MKVQTVAIVGMRQWWVGTGRVESIDIDLSGEGSGEARLIIRTDEKELQVWANATLVSYSKRGWVERTQNSVSMS